MSGGIGGVLPGEIQHTAAGMPPRRCPIAAAKARSLRPAMSGGIGGVLPGEIQHTAAGMPPRRCPERFYGFGLGAPRAHIITDTFTPAGW